MLLELFVDPLLHPVVVGLRVTLDLESELESARDITRTEVGRHDDDGVLEVHLTTLRVGQATVFEDLQQRVEDVRVGLLHLVEEDDRERLPADLLRELTALFVSDISRR